jgi:microcystin-dependent protein
MKKTISVMNALFLLVSLSINVMANPNIEEDIDDLECYIKRQVAKQVTKQLESIKQQFPLQIEEIKNQRIPSKCFCFDSPVGEIIAFAGINDTQVDSAGYIPCDGRELSALEYPDLFQAIGTIYGASGTNFKVPNLRGVFLRGTGGNAAPLGQKQGDATKTHQHYMFSSAHHQGRNDKNNIVNHPNSASSWKTVGGHNYLEYSILKAPDNSGATSGITSQNIAGDIETRPVNYAVHYYIKAKDKCKNMCHDD